MKERDFKECDEFSEMGSGVVAVLDALAMANFDELVILSSYSDSHEWVVTYWSPNDVLSNNYKNFTSNWFDWETP